MKARTRKIKKTKKWNDIQDLLAKWVLLKYQSNNNRNPIGNTKMGGEWVI